MKKSVRLLAALLMLVGIIAGTFSVASAEAPMPTANNAVFLPIVDAGAVVHVQNMGAVEARYTICYEFGTPACTESGWINPGSSWTFIPSADRAPVQSAPWVAVPQGAAVVMQIAPVVDATLIVAPFGVSVDRVGVQGGNPAAGGGNGSYTGIGPALLPALDMRDNDYYLYAPVVHADFNGWKSLIHVMNVQVVPAQFDVWFYNSVGNPVAAITNFQLDALSSVAIDPTAPPAGLVPGTYSAVIRVTGLDTASPTGAAAVVDEYKGGLALTYRASPWQNAAPASFIIGQTPNPITGTVAEFAPLIFKSFNQWNAGIRVTNVDPNQHAQVKITFRNTDGVAVGSPFVDDIDRQSFKDYFFADMDVIPQNFVGSATVESQPYSPANGNFGVVPVISVVQLVKWASGTEAAGQLPKEGMAYNTINWNEGSPVLSAPFLSKYATDGFSSGLQIMNMDRTDGMTDADVNLFTAAGPIWTVRLSLQPLSTKTLDLRNISGDMIPVGFVGSGNVIVDAATTTQTAGGYLGGVVNEVSFAAGLSDGGKTYELFPLVQVLAPITGVAGVQ